MTRPRAAPPTQTHTARRRLEFIDQLSGQPRTAQTLTTRRRIQFRRTRSAAPGPPCPPARRARPVVLGRGSTTLKIFFRLRLQNYFQHHKTTTTCKGTDHGLMSKLNIYTKKIIKKDIKDSKKFVKKKIKQKKIV